MRWPGYSSKYRFETLPMFCPEEDLSICSKCWQGIEPVFASCYLENYPNSIPTSSSSSATIYIFSHVFFKVAQSGASPPATLILPFHHILNQTKVVQNRTVRYSLRYIRTSLQNCTDCTGPLWCRLGICCSVNGIISWHSWYCANVCQFSSDSGCASQLSRLMNSK